MPAPVQHPLLGPLVPNAANDTLIGLRRFPHLRPFWYDDRERRLRLLSPAHRDQVRTWADHAADLLRASERHPEITPALRAHGVFRVEIPAPRDGGPSAAQEAGITNFLADEELVCRNMVDALGRYYRVAREELPDDGYEFDDYPEEPSPDELGEIFTFNDLSVCRCAADRTSPLLVSWQADWDPEQGLSMVVYRGQVLVLGAFEEATDLLSRPGQYSDYGLWRRCVAEAERSMRDRFVKGFEPGDLGE